MLPHFRLRRSSALRQLRRQGQRWSHPLATLIAVPNGLAISRFGFSASRRVGRAVARNRAKRLLRETIRLRLERIQPGWDCLFIAREATTQATFAEVDQAVAQLIGRARLLKPEG